jgi:hypothetical protein
MAFLESTHSVSNISTSASVQATLIRGTQKKRYVRLNVGSKQSSLFSTISAEKIRHRFRILLTNDVRDLVKQIGTKFETVSSVLRADLTTTGKIGIGARSSQTEE